MATTQRPTAGPTAGSGTAWLVVSGIFAVYFVFGLSIGIMAPMVDEISNDLGLSRATMGSILGAWPLIYILTAIPCGVLVDRLGIRTSMLLGAVTIALSFALRAMAVGGVSLFLAVSVFGIGGPLVSIASPKAVATLFAEEGRRLPLGVTTAAPTLGSAVGLALPDPVLLPAFDDNWRPVLLLAAALSALAATYWWWAADRVDAPAVDDASNSSLRSRLELLRLRSLRWILLLSALTFTIGHGLNGWFPEMLVDGGLSEARAGYVAALATLLGIAGGVGFSRSVPITRRPTALGIILFGMALGVAGVVSLSGAALTATALIIGFIRSGMVPMLMLGIIDDPGIDVAQVGAATGLFFTISQFGGFGGPTVIGALADRSGDFTTAGAFLVAVCLAGIAATFGWARSVGVS